MKMTTMKRVLAATSAIAMLFSTCINSGMAAIAETTSPDESTFSVNVPDTWTNTINGWVEASEDIKVYFKVSDHSQRDSAWGTYSDLDAKEWNQSVDLNETDADGDYIKFWAVKGETIQSDPEAIHFYYDRTMPNSFAVSVDEETEPYTLKSNDIVTDALSGISGIYYSIAQEYRSLDDITTNCAEALTSDDRNGKRFSVECTSDMSGNTVYFYAVDIAGNVQISSINVDSYMDTSAPSLVIEGIDANSWVNNDARMSSWNVHTDSFGAKVYYKVSDTDLLDSWGDYSDATEWSDNATIPEGEKYIHFWAAYDSSEREVAEETRAYKYDNSESTLTFNDTQRIFDQSTYTWKLNISSKTLSDNYSGVNSVHLRFYNNNNFKWYDQEINDNDITRETDGTITAFSIDLGDWLKDTKIAFLVTDRAGNSKEFCLDGNNTIDFDPQSPVIDIDSLKIMSSDQKPLSYHAFGSKNQKNENNSVYVNDDAYIYLEVKDNDLRAIKFTINENSSIEIKENDLENGNGEWKTESHGRDANNKYCIRIKTSLLKEKLAVNGKNFISIIALDSDPNHKSNIATFNIDEDNQYSILYDPNDNKDSIIIPKTINEPSPADDGNKYFGKNYNENVISFDINDDNGIKEYSVKVNGTVVTSADLSRGTETTGTYTTVVTNDDGEAVTTVVNETYYLPIDKTIHTIPLGNDEYKLYDFSKDGKYEIVVSAEDLAGNPNSKDYTFVIDTTAPIITNCEYKYNKSLIKYLSFGLFGNESYDISVKVTDITGDENVPGIGIESVKLFWDSDTDPYDGHYNGETGLYEFPSLRVGHNATPVIVVADKLGNTARYCMASADNTDDNNDHRANIQLEQLTLEDSEGKIPLVLENTPPTSYIELPETFDVPASFTDDEKAKLTIYKQSFNQGTQQFNEWWYPFGISYKVFAEDKSADINSGLCFVTVEENNSIKTETGYAGKEFKDYEQSDAQYSYELKDEGDYTLFVYAVDNAQNSNKPANDEPDRQILEPNQKAIVHLDLTSPKINKFHFGGELDDLNPETRQPYGFFFDEDTEVRVYVTDPGSVSSGIHTVQLWLDGIEDSMDRNFKVDIHNSNGNEYDPNEGFATFKIEKGFKGKVYAEVVDNVGHSSGIIDANGNIVEDSDLHLRTSTIEIQENEPTNQKDANGIPLYNTSIPVTVTVVDSFSGISHIDWSIANDNESGTIEVDINGNWRNGSGEAQILKDSIERDQNLITKLQFVIVVDSNTNGNVVHISLTDRSGNTSEYDTSYSIDTTAPNITATLGGGAASNGYYYNSNQTVTVSITERNFDPSAVVVKVNNNAQTVQWNEQGSSVTSDGTVHTGTFAITADGEYDFTISYTDMAGNVGTPYSQSRFIIDKTSPKISNNFESFGSIDDENIYYNASQKNSAKAEITVVETNFSPGDMNIVVYYQPAGSKHTDTGANWTNYYYSSDWKDSGDNTHTLNIPFTEDGVYKIVMAPVDRAGNAGDFSKGENSQYPAKTAIFEADYTVPIIVSRSENSVKADNVTFYDLYDFDRRNDAAPTVVFEDINIDRIVCEGQKYTPVYSNGREIGEIKPEDMSSESNKIVADTYVPQMIYTLEGFTVDGVYSAKLTAYDKAGNKSTLNDNTYVRMVDPTVNVLAYIENSNREKLEGWYSFEDENGPISKQPSSFSDLSIVVLSKTNDTHIYLVDKATNASTDTNITDAEDALFDAEMYGVGAYRYTLPGEYFEKNYTADADTNLYLRVENDGETLDLGEMYIDNTDPDCNIPEHFHDWGWFKGSGNQTITFDNISETLDINETVAYVDGNTIHLSNVSGNEASPFSYDEQNNTLTLTLEPGSHKVGLLLVDRAGNNKSISEVQHLAIGNYRIWIGIGSGLGAILLAVLAVFGVKKFKRRRLA